MIQCLTPSAVTSLGSPAKLLKLGNRALSAPGPASLKVGTRREQTRRVFLRLAHQSCTPAAFWGRSDRSCFRKIPWARAADTNRGLGDSCADKRLSTAMGVLQIARGWISAADLPDVSKCFRRIRSKHPCQRPPCYFAWGCFRYFSWARAPRRPCGCLSR